MRREGIIRRIPSEGRATLLTIRRCVECKREFSDTSRRLPRPTRCGKCDPPEAA